MTRPRPITLDDEINEVIRELEMRERAYPKLIAAQKMRPEHADRRMKVMTAVLHRLRDLQEGRILVKT